MCQTKSVDSITQNAHRHGVRLGLCPADYIPVLIATIQVPFLKRGADPDDICTSTNKRTKSQSALPEQCLSRFLLATSMSTTTDQLVFDEDQFVKLLSKLIGESKYLQNNPPELVPVEDRFVGEGVAVQCVQLP